VTAAEELLALALDVAREAADLLREHRAGDVAVAATKSSSVDVVTEADRASEELIRRRLLEARPADAFLGEEGGADRGGSGVRWVVDPVDGTVNFLYGLPEYAVSIAAEVDGEAVAGVVLNPATGVEYTAVRGGGAFRDGVPLEVRAPAPLSERLVLTGFSYSPDLRLLQGIAVARMLPRVRDIRRHGAAALELCRIGEGSADAYVEEGLNPWDWAAGLLVATEAGAFAEHLPGGGGHDLLVCAPSHGYDEFRAVVEECGFLVS
jgi:myo-inositol-1(or 4)-monophosphatase